MSSELELPACWRIYLNKALPARYQRRKEQKGLDPLALIPRAFPNAIQDVSSVFLRGRKHRDRLAKVFLRGRKHRDRLAKLEVGMTGARVLLVNSSIPDGELKDGFAKWLTAQRKLDPPPVSRRGPKPSNTLVTKGHLASWKYYGVLAVLDLDFWAELAGEKPLSHEALAVLLGASPRVDAKEWGRSARAKAKEALAAADLIAMQARRVD